MRLACQDPPSTNASPIKNSHQPLRIAAFPSNLVSSNLV